MSRIIKNTLLVAMAAGLIWSIGSAVAATNIIHRYNFNEAAGTTVADSVGGATGNLMQIVTNGVPAGSLPALNGAAVTLDGVGGYVDLPNGLISAHTNVTFEFWLTWDGAAEWERIFAFGCQTNAAITNAGFLEDTAGTNRNANGGDYLAHEVLFATANFGGSGGAIRFTASDAWWTRERPVLNDPLPVFGGTEFHFVITYGEGGARMFYDGIQTASGFPDPDGALPFLELPDVVDVNNWLGRAQYNDPMFAGSFNEFRIHDTLLTTPEIYASYANFNADVVNYDPGTSSGLAMTLKNNMIVGGTQEPGLTAFFSNLGTTIDIYGPDLDSLVSDNTNAVVVGPGRVLQAVGVGSATITATLGGDTQMATITVSEGVPVLKHRYSLTSDATDSVGGANGTVVAPLAGGAAVSFAGGEADFPGGSYTNVGYIDLPDNLLSVMTNVTIETWFTWDGPSGTWWQRVFDFGNSQKGTDAHADGGGLGYIMLTTRGGDGIRSEARSEAPHVAVQLDGPALTVGQEHYAVVVYAPDASLSRLYLDGIAVSSQGTPFTLDSMVDQNMWLGMAQWNDPPLDGRINELRIHEGVLTDLDVAISRYAGPDDPNPGDPGALNSVSVNDVDLLLGAPGTAQAILLGTFDNYTNVDISGVSGVVFAGDNTNVVTVTGAGLITQVGVGSAGLTGSYSGQQDTATISVLAPLSLDLQLTNQLDVYGEAQGALLGTFSGQTNVDVSGFDGVVWSSSNPSAATVTDAGLVSGAGPGTTEIVVSYGGLSFTNEVTVVLPGGYTTPSLAHRYSFTTDASDSIGSADGTLVDGPMAGTPVVSGGLLQLNNPGFTGPSSNANYLALPATILPGSGSVTIEQWFTYNGSGFNTEGWAFSDRNGGSNPPGASSGQYFMHVISNPQGGPNPAGGGSRITQTLAGYGGGAETGAYSTTVGLGAGGGGYLDDGVAYYSATVIDGISGTLRYYVYRVSDGLGGLQSAIPAIDLSAYSFTEAFIGKSPFDGDNATAGSVDEFRVWNGALVGSDIAAAFATGPDSVISPIVGGGPELTITEALPNVILSWSASASGFNLEASELVTGAYSTNGLPAPSVVGDQFQVTLPATNESRYFRLSE